MGINAVTLEAMDVTHDELVMNGVSVQIKLAKDLPLVHGDRVQLLQVMDNLIINAIEAMSPHAAGARGLLIRTVKTNSGSVLVAVCDSGPGVDPANLSASSTHISPRRPVVWERAYRSARAVPPAVRETEALWRMMINLVPERADAPGPQNFE